jgi:hypothetical protein
MARKKKSRPSTLKRWSSAELKMLRQHAGKKTITQIAKVLKRTVAAVRLKASSHRVSLRKK